MRALNSLLIFSVIASSLLPAYSRPAESVQDVLKRYEIENQKPFTQDDYIAYKVKSTKFQGQPTLFLKVGAKGIVLEQNFLFDKNTVHEKDVQRSKNDSEPTASIPHQEYLIGDFSQLPRESYDVWDRVLGGFAAPLGAAAGTVVGAGKGAYYGTKIGIGTAGQASRALGGDASGKAGAFAASTTAVATGAITGLFAGLTGGVVEGSARGARVGIEGLSGADRNITGEIKVASEYAIVGGRIGKELTPEEQKDLLKKLTDLEQARLASEGIGGDANKKAETPDTGDSGATKKPESYLDDFDSAKAKNDFDNADDTSYKSEDAQNKNVAGMW